MSLHPFPATRSSRVLAVFRPDRLLSALELCASWLLVGSHIVFYSLLIVKGTSSTARECSSLAICISIASVAVSMLVGFGSLYVTSITGPPSAPYQRSGVVLPMGVKLRSHWFPCPCAWVVRKQPGRLYAEPTGRRENEAILNATTPRPLSGAWITMRFQRSSAIR